MLQRASEIGRLQAPVACSELGIWAAAAPVYSRVAGRLPAGLAAGHYCAVIAAEFDQDWAQQDHPDPNVKPRTHPARARLEDHYQQEASEGPMKIDEYRVKLFLAHGQLLRVPGPKAPEQEATSIAAQTRAPEPATPIVAQTWAPEQQAAAAVKQEIQHPVPDRPVPVVGRDDSRDYAAPPAVQVEEPPEASQDDDARATAPTLDIQASLMLAAVLGGLFAVSCVAGVCVACCALSQLSSYRSVATKDVESAHEAELATIVGGGAEWDKDSSLA